MSTRFPSGTLDKLWTDPNNWRGCIVYVCKDDPRLIVPKRSKWGGWTLNFAHPSVWLLLSSVLLSILIPTLFFLRGGPLGIALGLALEVGIIVSWCVLSAVLSSPKRYETAG